MSRSYRSDGDPSAARKREMLAGLIRKRGSKGVPLSFAQERLWFLHNLSPSGHLYNLSKAVAMTGSLEVTALEQVLSEIIRRHEILRTTYTLAGGVISQVISASARLSLQVVDLEALSVEEREARARRIARSESSRPFDLSKGPVLRISLLRLGLKRHVLLLTLHHIAGDGISLGLLMYELAVLYLAYTKGKRSPLSELTIQYADFAVWQRRQLKGEALDRHLAYWKKELGGVLPSLALPTDFLPPAVRTHRGASRFFKLNEAVTQALNGLSREESASLFMTLLAGFNTLLYRYTGQHDIVVGSPISHRHRIELEPLIGCLINTLALRTDLSGNPTFRELLRRVRKVTLGAYAHQNLPFDRVVQELQPERRLSPTPLFKVWFVLDHVTAGKQEGVTLGELKFDDLYAAAPAAQFDLTISMCELDSILIGFLTYSTDLLKEETVGNMLEHFKTLLEQVAADPDRGILDIPVSKEDRNYTASAHLTADEDDRAEFLF